MSKRCRQSLLESGGGRRSTIGDRGLDAGCDCARLGQISEPTPPCLEPLTYGQLLEDPGFERQFELQDNGLLEIAGWSSSINSYYWGGDPFNPDATKLALPVPLPWHSNFSNQWILNTVDQETGNYCVRSTQTPGASTQFLVPAKVKRCTGSLEPMFRSSLGDLITATVRVRATVAGNAWFFNWSFLNNTGPSFVGAASAQIPVGTTFETLTSQAFVSNSNNPASEPYWTRLQMRGDIVGGGGPQWIVDNASVILAASSAQNIPLCAQATLITIDNDTTETAFL